MKTVDIVIPVHNCVHWAAWCLQELIEKTTCPINVIVIDDRSDEEQMKKLNEIVERFRGVKLVVNDGNDGGFGYACNLGAKNGDSDIILFLNTDCFVARNTVRNLVECFEDEKVVLACPVSNNSPDLTYEMWPGKSYIQMAEFIEDAFDTSGDPSIFEACTIVGNCLAVRRVFFNEVAGFSSEWGVGYGEETDLHMKAYERGLKGVVNLKSYVYHFGSGTFALQNDVEKQKAKNYNLFMGKWKSEYQRLRKLVSSNPPLNALDAVLKKHLEKTGIDFDYDILFYLPGVDQSIGGIHAVVSICNELIKRGIKAGCALVGVFSMSKLSGFKEPILFNFLYYISEDDFINDNRIRSKIFASTIFTSSESVRRKAEAAGGDNIQFVQGYECLFENGTRYIEAVESYKQSATVVVTTEWLRDSVSQHLSKGQVVTKLPLVVNNDIFFASEDSLRKYDASMVLRSADDKGQWKLLEILNHLEKSGLKTLVFYSAKYASISAADWKHVDFIELPIDQYRLAKMLRKVKVFVDASLHEGYGLMPYEAALCGANLVVTNSGGVTEYADYFDTEFFDISEPPKNIVNKIRAGINRRGKGLVCELRDKNIEEWVKFIQSARPIAVKSHPLKEDSEQIATKDRLIEKKKTISDKFKKIAARIYQELRPHLSDELHAYIKYKLKRKLMK